MAIAPANNSSPYCSTIVFLVPKGKPWKIRDWPDLVKPGIEVITPNPKTSASARWAYLAACASALRAPGCNPAKAQAFVEQFSRNIPTLDTRARLHRDLRPARPGQRPAVLGERSLLAGEEFGDTLGGWKKAQAVRFAHGGVFDRIYQPR